MPHIHIGHWMGHTKAHHPVTPCDSLLGFDQSPSPHPSVSIGCEGAMCSAVSSMGTQSTLETKRASRGSSVGEGVKEGTCSVRFLQVFTWTGEM